MRITRVLGAILLALLLTACGGKKQNACSECGSPIDTGEYCADCVSQPQDNVEAVIVTTEPSAHVHVFSEATCADPGKCQCGSTDGAPLGHSWEDPTCTAAAVCTRCGIATGMPLDHAWEDATCTAAAVCTRCGTVEGTPLNHTWVEATCTAPAFCIGCGETSGTALGHSYSAKRTPATCLAQGYTTYICVCGDAYVADYVSGDHKYAQYVCSVCQKIDPAHTYEYWVEYGGQYYLSLSQAVADIQSDTLGVHADADKESAVAVAFELDEKSYVVLRKDAAEPITLSGTLTLDLNGKTLAVEGTSAITVEAGEIVIDGKTAGSTVCIDGSDSGSAIIQNGGQLTLLGGAYRVENATKGIGIKIAGGTARLSGTHITSSGTDTNYGVAVQSGATVNGENLEICATGTGTTYGFYGAGSFDIRTSNVTALSDGAKSRALYVPATGSGTVSKCNFSGLCALYQATGTSSSQGINNAGTLTVNDCYAWGSHSGVTNSGSLRVYGGTYESPGHGGMYFGNIATPAYVYDATLRVAQAPENSTSAADYNDCGFYIGGGSDRNHVVVYMDNCQIYANTWAFCLRDSSNEHDNTLYISNSTVTGNGYVRVDNASHKLYIGTGNNFAAEDVKDKNNIPMPDAVVTTDETYRLP